MKIVVVYESLFGNTRTIAEAIGEGLQGAGDVVVGSVDDISPESVGDAGLIVAGGPTHAHGMVSATTRRGSEKDARYGPILRWSTLLRDWIEALPEGPAAAAAFDTRFDKPAWLTGSAAKKISRRLSRRGFTVLATDSFLVVGASGPLADGEVSRATEWGRTIAEQLKDAAAA